MRNGYATLFRQFTVGTSGGWLPLNRPTGSRLSIGMIPNQIPKIRGSTILLKVYVVTVSDKFVNPNSPKCGEKSNFRIKLPDRRLRSRTSPNPSAVVVSYCKFMHTPPTRRNSTASSFRDWERYFEIWVSRLDSRELHLFLFLNCYASKSFSSLKST